MGMIIYKRYQIRLRTKLYDILVPYLMPKKLWFNPMGHIYKNADYSPLYGDRKAMKVMRDIFTTLAIEKEKIIYLPLEEESNVLDQLAVYKIPQILFYNHHIQLKRSEWKDILKAIQKYVKPEFYVVRYSFPELERQYERMMHQWKKQKSYYKSEQVKEYFENGMLFYECDWRNSLRTAVKVNRKLGEDLESQAKKRDYVVPVWIGPFTNTWGWLELYYASDPWIEEYILKDKYNIVVT